MTFDLRLLDPFYINSWEHIPRLPWHTFPSTYTIHTIMSESPSTTSKDLEGVSEPVEYAPQASQAKETKQRKIAVLTSGGDSAGMNAAGVFISHSS